jgi:NTE family protein
MQAIALNLKHVRFLDYNLMGTFKYLLSLICHCYEAPLEGIFWEIGLEDMIYKLKDGKKLSEVSMPLGIVAFDIEVGERLSYQQDLEIERSDVLIIQDALISEAVRCSVSIPVTFVPKDFGV